MVERGQEIEREAKVVGTPDDVAKMTQAYMKGMGVARTIDGFLGGASEEALQGIAGLGSNLASLVAAAAKRVGAQPEDVQSGTTAALGARATDDDGNGAAPAKK